MFKRILIAGLVAASATASFAGGQMGQQANPFYLRAGILFPSDGDVKDFVSDTGYHVALGYRTSNQSFLMQGRGRPSVELDYYNVSGNGADVTSWGLWYIERVPLSEGMTNNGVYGGLGLGFVFNNIDAGASVDNSRFGFLALLGYDINANFFIEGQYRWAGKLEGVNMDGLSLMLGYRF